MTSLEGLTRVDLANRLGVSVSVLRKWEDLFDTWLVTPKGVKGYGAAKHYDPQDVRVLALVHKMRQEGQTLEQIREGLSDRLATAADELTPDLPTLPDRPQEVSLQAYVELGGRLQATEGELKAVLENRDYLRAQLRVLQDRLLDAERRAAAAEGKLDLLQDKTPPSEEDKTRPSLLDRLLGRQSSQ